MATQLSLFNFTALFLAMFLLAIVPSVSVLTVTARTMLYGAKQGVVTTIGIITADLVFILAAITGFSIVYSWLEGVGAYVVYFASAYLIWMGLSMLRVTRGTKAVPLERGNHIVGSSELEREATLVSGFIAGFLLTIVDVKAILFYIAFLPAFIDLERINLIDTLLIIMIGIVALSVAKLSYVFLVVSSGNLWRGTSLFSLERRQKLSLRVQQLAAVMLLLIAMYLPLAVIFLDTNF